MQYSVFIFHLANVLNMTAWLVTDILWVRLLAVCGNMLTIFYYMQHTDLYQVNIAWHALYITINVVQISMLLYRRRPITFAHRELELFRLAFVGLSPFEFQRLMKLARWVEAPTGTVLARRDENLENVMILVHGNAKVTVEGVEVSTLEPGNFVGEISFIHGGPATADVFTMAPALLVSWDKHELKKFLRRNQSLSNAWQIGMGHDLVKKVSFHTKASNDNTLNHSSILET